MLKGLEYLDASVSKTEGFEGRIQWLYLDGYRNVTVGVGRLLSNLLAAQALPFKSSDGTLATEDQVAQDFARVSAMDPGHLATYYLASSSIRLLNEDIDGMLSGVVANNDRWLREQFKAYASWPTCAKLATLDMIYNLGPTRFLRYTELNKALEAQDWNTAAKQSGRNIHDPAFVERNRWTICQFLDAGKQV